MWSWRAPYVAVLWRMWFGLQLQVSILMWRFGTLCFVLSINQQRPCGTSSSTAACQGERGKNKPSKRVLEVQQPVSPWIVVYSFFPLRQWDDSLLDNISTASPPHLHKTNMILQRVQLPYTPALFVWMLQWSTEVILSKHSAEPCTAACVSHQSITDKLTVISALMENMKTSHDGSWCLVLVEGLQLRVQDPSVHPLICPVLRVAGVKGVEPQTSSSQGLQDMPCEKMNGLHSAP